MRYERERYERHLLLRIFEEFNSMKNHELQNAYLRSRVRFSRYENLRNNQRSIGPCMPKIFFGSSRSY